MKATCSENTTRTNPMSSISVFCVSVIFLVLFMITYVDGLNSNVMVPPIVFIVYPVFPYVFTKIIDSRPVSVRIRECAFCVAKYGPIIQSASLHGWEL